VRYITYKNAATSQLLGSITKKASHNISVKQLLRIQLSVELLEIKTVRG